MEEPSMDVAHLGHLEVLTPKPEESLHFFVDVMGMTESGRKGDSVYLHAWDDYERYSLQLTASHTSGLGHAAFRTRSPQALARRVKTIEGSGGGIGWREGDFLQSRGVSPLRAIRRSVAGSGSILIARAACYSRPFDRGLT
jgi:catechol 2,3-dioxygenase